MTFGEACNEVVVGKKIRREEWEDDGTYLCMAENVLMIFKTDDNMLHPLKVSYGDITATDWVVVSQGV